MRTEGEVLQHLLMAEDNVVRSDVKIHCKCDILSAKKRIYLRVSNAQMIISPIELFCVNHRVKDWSADAKNKKNDPSGLKAQFFVFHAI